MTALRSFGNHATVGGGGYPAAVGSDYVLRPYLTVKDGELADTGSSSGRVLLSGATMLRDARLATAMTQERLASFAGLHVRTIRGIESGRISSPRRDSLSRIAAALSMGVAHRQEFLAAWSVQEAVVLNEAEDAIVVEGESSELLKRLTKHNLNAMRFVAVSETVTVDERLQTKSKSSVDVVMAQQDGFDRWYAIYRPDHDVTLEPFDMTALDNCHLGETVLLRDQGVKLFEIVLDEPLQRGETAIVRHKIEFPTDHEYDCKRVVRGFFTPLTNYVLQVQFDPANLPTKVEQIYQRRPLAVLQSKALLRLNPSNVSHIVVTEPLAGGHGMQWE